MKIVQPRIGLAVLSAGLVLGAGCAVQNGRLVFVPPTVNVTYSFELTNLRQRAIHGDPIAQYTLGSCYANGRGCVQNYAQAAHWYQLSAKQGYPPAQNRLGFCYESGRGCVQNYAQAVHWYQFSANQGYPPAQRNLERLTSQPNPSAPTPAPPAEDHISVAEIKELSKENKPDAVIAQIKESNSKYSPQEIAELQQDNTVDRAVIGYIQNNATSSPR